MVAALLGFRAAGEQSAPRARLAIGVRNDAAAYRPVV
jgi:hypothetical protein